MFFVVTLLFRDVYPLKINSENMTTYTPKELMLEAVRLAKDSIEQGGGPFGAVVARKGHIVARASNRVALDRDPTAHAEVCAIREACKVLGTFRLDDCEIYASTEPCPMCLSAIYWARIERVWYGSTRQDASRAGFDDDFIYRELGKAPRDRSKKMLQLMTREATDIFALWKGKIDKVSY